MKEKITGFVCSDVKTYHWLVMMGFLAYGFTWLDKRREGVWK